MPQNFASFDPFDASTHTLHPRFVQLGLLMSNREITGASRRADFLLLAFKQFIDDFPTALPAAEEPDALRNSAEERSFPMLLSKSLTRQYEYICSVRSPSVPMKRVYEEIHEVINSIDRSTEPQHAKEQIQRKVNDLQNVGETRRADLQGLRRNKEGVVKHLMEMIDQDDVIVTFGESSRITEALVSVAAKWKGRKAPFRVIVIGSRPKKSNENMLRRLVKENVPCTLAPLNALPYVMEVGVPLGSHAQSATKALISATAMLINGSAIADIGTVRSKWPLIPLGRRGFRL